MAADEDDDYREWLADQRGQVAATLTGLRHLAQELDAADARFGGEGVDARQVQRRVVRGLVTELMAMERRLLEEG